jgi:hypothetical protein
VDRYEDRMGWRSEFLKSIFDGTDASAGRRSTYSMMGTNYRDVPSTVEIRYEDYRSNLVAGIHRH